MIYISLEDGGIKVFDRQKIYCSLPLVMPLVFKISEAVSLLNREHNVSCGVYVRIGNTINLEVKND